jgi:deoxyribodipyrimidine photolyase
MGRNIMIYVRASRQEYERMRDAMNARGFSSMSSYLRTIGMDRDLWMEKKLQETNLLVRELHKVITGKPVRDEHFKRQVSLQ